ncbi:MAG: transporter substrate-binding domain-containing protein [Marinobacter sp.]|uniref:substrate-binding periplasmic protein n=1 Tax=Marinobacter sp. TaxID=50741 RepID=UPI00299CECCE|nr:transporter substrate-binding domain-containing protein [Marinobacter sp.]MDX1634860.1 transporter substrate-binding domain-containing protein [Marinobacter sp.]
MTFFTAPTRLIRVLTLLGLCLPLLLQANVSVVAAGEQADVRLTSGHWPPYFDQDAPHQGLLSRIISLAFAQSGLEVRYEFLPWSRSLMMASRAPWQGSAAWSCRPALTGRFLYSQPLIPHNYVLFHRRSMPLEWQGLTDLQSLRLGLTQDYFYGRQVGDAILAGLLGVDVARSDEINFRKLAAGRIDLFPMEPAVGLKMLEELGLAAEITYHPRPIETNHLYLLLNRSDPASERLMTAFNEGLTQLRESGKLEQILAAGFTDLPARLKPTPAEMATTACP